MLITLLLLACDGGEAPASCPSFQPSLDRVDAPSGYRVLEVPVDAPWVTEARTVPVSLWYATDDADGEAAQYMDAFPDESSWVDAGFADPGAGCKLPLAVYSHGSQGWAGNSSPLSRHLAAAGWIVAAPDHVGNTLADNVDPRPPSFPVTRVADMLATIDALEALPSSDPLYDRIDTSRVLIFGHSFGGQTSWLLSGPTFDGAAIDQRCADAGGCSDAERAAFDRTWEDPRIAGVVPMDGSASTELVAAEGWQTAEIPIFYMARSQEGDNVPFDTAAAAAELSWARFEGACHETFTSTAMPCDTFDKDEGLDIVATYLSAFAARQVLDASGEIDGILDGSTVVDARVTLRRNTD